ncbi:hypothetical protein B0H21DRAFT_321173 [Amylocystis lapponica]|nr:hypothetical protein B0H21DRAFT_321173 [Amylocystis lapponica]
MDGWMKNQLIISVDRSLRVHGVSYLDSVLMHSPCKSLSDTGTVFSALVELQDASNVKHIGMSNTYDVVILEAIGTPATGESRSCRIGGTRATAGIQRDFATTENGTQYQFSSPARAPEPSAHSEYKELPAEQAPSRLAQLHGILFSGTADVRHMREDVTSAQNKTAMGAMSCSSFGQANNLRGRRPGPKYRRVSTFMVNELPLRITWVCNL